MELWLQSRWTKWRNVEMHALKTYGEIHGELFDGLLARPGARHSWAVKDAKGRCSVLNVTQPRRKAKLQLVQSTVLSSAPYCYPFWDALLSATWYRDDASELRVREERCAGSEDKEWWSFVRMRLENEFPSPFSGAKFNCTCSCPGKNANRLSNAAATCHTCAHTKRGFVFFRCQLGLVRYYISRTLDVFG